MQLEHVRLERCNNVEQRVIVGIDGERDLADAALDPLAERAGSLQSQVTRTRRKKDETNQIGPGIKRHIKRLRSFQATDFDRQRHREARSSAFSSLSQSGTAPASYGIGGGMSV